MRRFGVGLLVLAFAIIAATSFAHASERKGPPAVGEAAPELALGDQNGRRFVLSEVLKEREFVVLAFYPKAFTSG